MARKERSDMKVETFENKRAASFGMDKLEQKLLIEQTRKETLDNLKQYLVGFCHDGHFVVRKGGEWQGEVFVIPDEKYKELFGD